MYLSIGEDNDELDTCQSGTYRAFEPIRTSVRCESLSMGSSLGKSPYSEGRRASEGDR